MSKLDYLDIHGHINFPDYGDERPAVIKRAQDQKVGMITVGTDLVSSMAALEVAKANENIWATVGIHPTEAKLSITEPLSKLASDPKVVAIGECGLDHYHSKEEDIPVQIKMFEEHIELANSVNKPLMLHVRNGKAGGNAYDRALQLIHAHSKVRGNFHFFAGNMDDLKKIIDHNCTVSFTGVITFTHDYDELIKYVPLSHIMSETDCPFVAPVPYRGKTNEPGYVIEVAKAIAKIRNEDEVKVREQLVKNAQDFFSIS